MQARENNIKWFYKPLTVVIAVFIAGPFALPLVWLSPILSKPAKIVFTVFLILMTAWMVKLSVETYEVVINQMSELEAAL